MSVLLYWTQYLAPITHCESNPVISYQSPWTKTEILQHCIPPIYIYIYIYKLLCAHHLCTQPCFPAAHAVTSGPYHHDICHLATRTASPSADPAAASWNSGSLCGHGYCCRVETQWKQRQSESRLRNFDDQRLKRHSKAEVKKSLISLFLGG